MKRILILGSTGSIGTQALEVIKASPDLEVAGLAAASDKATLAEQAKRFDIRDLAMADEAAGELLQKAVPTAVVIAGPGSVAALVDSVDCDLVLNAVVGAAGLEATIATLGKGVELALANKESLVVGGELVNRMADEKGIKILPVDSEHSAIFQCLQGADPTEPDRIFLTASGGPFFGKARQELTQMTREDALDHPRWKMGSKITIDSATLMNKGLEIIEAHYLFDTAYADIEVLVHPQSIVHSLVRFRDGSVLAQLGRPSMRLPIAYALHYPQRKPASIPVLDLTAEEDLSFSHPDLEAFPCLRLAMEAGERGGGAPVALNAANEVAVAAFLEGRLGFNAIADVVRQTLTAMDAELPGTITALPQILELDSQARQRAESLIV